MVSCNTDCVVRPLSGVFKKMGHFIGSHPWWFLIAPLVISAGLGSGFYFLNERMSNNIEEQFTPINGPAKLEREYIEETFPGNKSMFSSLRLSRDGTYATLIATNDKNILTVKSLQEVLDLDFKVRDMAVKLDDKPFKYSNVCAEVAGSCYSNAILAIIGSNASNIDKITLTYPWYGSIPLFLNLGSVTLKTEGSVVEHATAIQLYYYLQEDNKAKTDLWLESFINLKSPEPPSSIEVSYSTSMSMQWELEKSPDSVIYLFAITYAIAITFSIVSCWRLDKVRNKVWVAYCGVFCTALSVLSGFGLLLLVGQTFVMTVASCPFMILGIGLDDMFIMISCWERTGIPENTGQYPSIQDNTRQHSCVLNTVTGQLSKTYKDAAVSITITSLTDALALFLGYSSQFGSIRSFCLYAGTCIVFCYLYNITLLGAFMALNGRREAENKHWFTCAKIPEQLSGNSKGGRGEGSHQTTRGNEGRREKEKKEIHFMSHLFEKYYGPFLTCNWVKACVFVIYAGYLAVSIYGCTTLKEGLDIRNLALDDSYLITYYSNQRQHFAEYSLNAMVAVKQEVQYWEENIQKQLNSCIAKFENLDYVNGTSAWFLSYQQYANALKLNISSQEAFQNNLTGFLQHYPMFRQDINMSADDVIQASRFFIQTLNKVSEKDMLLGLRKAAEECSVKLLVYHPAFIYFDQYTVIISRTIETILVATVAMLIISLILIPNPLCSIWVAFAICSVIVGVAGFMALWSVRLDSISMINLVMCIGFSVDFSAHISYSFVSSPKKKVNDKAIDAVAHLGYPILQGAVSTILGVVVLAVSPSYIFRTFFKIMFLVIMFGLFHGLMFIPVFLMLFGACGMEGSSNDGPPLLLDPLVKDLHLLSSTLRGLELFFPGFSCNEIN
ncbi:hypothetical protein LDENG_00134310 [Lucifuga dentata]|nr:hypothetical protein LDENG_00134310 [Lucifuga dentata]